MLLESHQYNYILLLFFFFSSILSSSSSTSSSFSSSSFFWLFLFYLFLLFLLFFFSSSFLSSCSPSSSSSSSSSSSFLLLLFSFLFFLFFFLSLSLSLSCLLFYPPFPLLPLLNVFYLNLSCVYSFCFVLLNFTCLRVVVCLSMILLIKLFFKHIIKQCTSRTRRVWSPDTRTRYPDGKWRPAVP